MVAQTKETVFECSMCGECCTSVTVPIEKEKAAYLLDQDWVQQRFKEKNLPAEFWDLDEDHHQVPMTDESTCVFLDDEKKCMIHGIEGEDRKPLECMRFPFATVKMPDETLAYDVSSSCKSVASHLLIQFAQIVPDANYIPLVRDEPFPEEIPVGAFRTCDLNGYHQYLQVLAEIYENPDVHPEFALKQVYQALQQLPEKPAQWKTRFRFWPLWNGYVLWFFLRRPYGILNRLAVMTEGDYTDPKIFGLAPVSLKGHRKLAWDGQTLDPLINAYLYNLLQRKVLLAFGHSLSGILVIAIHGYFLVRWYARTLALIQEKTAVEPEDVTMAIRITERYYTGHQPYFLEFFRMIPFLDGYLKQFVGF